MPIPNKRVVIDLFNVFASDEEINVLAAWVRCSNNIVSTVAAMPNQLSFRYFKTSPVIIRLVVIMYIRYPLSLRNVEDLLDTHRIDISREIVRFWWSRLDLKWRRRSNKAAPLLIQSGVSLLPVNISL